MKIINFLALLLFSSFTIVAQSNETAASFLQRVSQVYANAKDYQAVVSMSKNGVSTQTGILYYKSPDLLKLSYSSPAGQTLLLKDNILQLYLPTSSMIMKQNLKDGSSVRAVGIGAGHGLDILTKNYSVSYLKSAIPEPLQNGSSEMVVKLKFDWRSSTEGFRSLEVSINPQTLFIRRVVGVNYQFETIQFDFTRISFNTGLQASLFVLEVKDSSTISDYADFLFSPDN